MAGTRPGPFDFLSGFWLPLRGFGLLTRHGSLFALAIVPVVLTILATVGAGAVVLNFGDTLLWAKPDPAAVTGAMATVWAWLGVVAWWLGRITLATLAAVLGMVLARVVSAPVMDLLAQKAMQYLHVKPPAGVRAFGDLPLAQSIPQSLLRAATRGLVLLAGIALLFGLSFIPGAAVVTTPLGAVWTGLWLFADTTLYALQWVGDARMQDVRRLFDERPWASLGFATAAGLMLAIPFVGFFLTPAAVAGACLFVGDSERQRTPPPMPVLA